MPLALAIGTFPSLIVRSGGLPDMTDVGFITWLSLIVLLALIPVTIKFRGFGDLEVAAVDRLWTGRRQQSVGRHTVWGT